MPIVEWEDKYLLGVEEFDFHHMQLVQLLNGTYDLYVSGGSPSEVVKVVEALADYATYHFSAEEEWMVELKYPDKDAHFSEHERFVKRVSEITTRLHSGTAHMTLEVISFLRNWLVDHIEKTDAKYGNFLKTGPF